MPPTAVTPVTEGAPVQQDHARDGMPLLGIDHIELYVGNAVQAAYFLTRALGFTETAFAGLETGARPRVARSRAGTDPARRDGGARSRGGGRAPRARAR